MEEASKAARADAKKKSGTQTTKKDPVESRDKPAATPETPAKAKAETPKSVGLFDSAPEPVAVHEGDVPISSGTQPSDAASETDEDEEILRESYAEGEAEEGDKAA
jgi:hypothetical protein